MISYSEREIFGEREQELLWRATDLVKRVQVEPRCHELARAVGQVLKLPHQDGYYGFVEHTWLWTEEREEYHPWSLPNLLDVYSVGSLPQVRLVDMKHTGPGHVQIYRIGTPRDDISTHAVALLVAHMERP
jgi:hypothetical protein